MLQYCFLLNEKSGLVQLGVGCDESYYIEIGMQQRDVEQSEKNGKWYLKEKCPHYTEEELTAQREQNFKFTFFEIEGYGWYRKCPKGYSSAVESLNTAFNVVSLMGKLPANTLIFYQKPDFTKPEECTDEWLIAHQMFNEEMNIQEFTNFYRKFMDDWNTQEHKKNED